MEIRKCLFPYPPPLEISQFLFPGGGVEISTAFKQRSDLSLYDHKFDLIYCQWNTRKPGAVRNVSFLMFSL